MSLATNTSLDELKAPLAAFLVTVAAILLAGAGPDSNMQDRYCAGMIIEFTFPGATRADCISKTHAIEVEFTEYWATALGQSLHYALWTKEIAEAPNDFPRWGRQIDSATKAGVILVSRVRSSPTQD